MLDSYSLLILAKEHQRDLIAEAGFLAAAKSEPARRKPRRPPLALVLAGIGRLMVTAGHRLERWAA